MFSENEYLWGYEDFVDIVGGHHTIGLYLGVISMPFRVFSYGQSTEWRIFLGLLKFQIFFGCWKFLIFFLECTVDAAPEPTYEEKMKIPPKAFICLVAEEFSS